MKLQIISRLFLDIINENFIFKKDNKNRVGKLNLKINFSRSALMCDVCFGLNFLSTDQKPMRNKNKHLLSFSCLEHITGIGNIFKSNEIDTNCLDNVFIPDGQISNKKENFGKLIHKNQSSGFL